MVAKPQVQAPADGPAEAVLDETSIEWIEEYAKDEAPRRENELAMRRAFDILSAITNRK